MIIKILENNNFLYIRQTGSHYIMQHTKDSFIVVVPFHGGNQELTPGTFKDIIKQSKLSKEKFIK